MSNPVHALTRRVVSSSWGAKLASTFAHHLDRPLIRWTNGRYSVASLLAGLPLVNLTTIGRKSGQPRTVPLVGMRDEEKLILIASNWGGNKHPAWYYNLTANPQVTVTVNGRTAPYTAREATEPERETYWELARQTYVGYDKYKDRAANRTIPVIVLTPANHSSR